jgi:hypothetical protein
MAACAGFGRSIAVITAFALSAACPATLAGSSQAGQHSTTAFPPPPLRGPYSITADSCQPIFHRPKETMLSKLARDRLRQASGPFVFLMPAEVRRSFMMPFPNWISGLLEEHTY